MASTAMVVAVLGQQRVEGTPVARDGERSLELPVPPIAGSRAKAAKEVQLGGVAEATAVRVEASVEAKAHRGAMAGQLCEGQVPEDCPPCSTSTDAGIRGIRRARDVNLPQSAGKSSLAELLPKLGLQASAGDRGLVDLPYAVGHAPMVGLRPYRVVRVRFCPA